MSDRLLDLQADKIERVLAAHHAPARVWGGYLTSDTVQFHLAPEPRTRWRSLRALKGQIAAALAVSSAKLANSQGRLELLVPRADPSTVSFLELNARLEADRDICRALSTPGTAILGVDDQQVPLLIRLSSPDVTHCLVAGSAASGKTELIRTIIMSLALHSKPHELQLALFDPEGQGLASFARLPHLLFPVTRELLSLLERMRYLVAEMERRIRDQIVHPRVVVVFDGLEDSVSILGNELETLFTRLVKEGHAAGISVIASMQEWTPEHESDSDIAPQRIVGDLTAADFAVRIASRFSSTDEPNQPHPPHPAVGRAPSVAEQHRLRGDFALTVGCEVIQLHAAFISPEEWLPLSARAMPQRSAKIIPFRRT